MKIKMEDIGKWVFSLLGGFAGWFVATFRPTFPLIAVALCFIAYDAYTAFRLGKRVAVKYPDNVKNEGKFNSDEFSKVLTSTIPSRLAAIVLAFMVEHWVLVFMNFPASYFVTGLICAEQGWSIMENESSCRDGQSNLFWRLLRKVMIDKTARHLNVSPEEIAELIKKESEKDTQ